MKQRRRKSFLKEKYYSSERRLLFLFLDGALQLFLTFSLPFCARISLLAYLYFPTQLTEQKAGLSSARQGGKFERLGSLHSTPETKTKQKWPKRKRNIMENKSANARRQLVVADTGKKRITGNKEVVGSERDRRLNKKNIFLKKSLSEI